LFKVPKGTEEKLERCKNDSKIGEVSQLKVLAVTLNLEG
jgi:hypothetical protein